MKPTPSDFRDRPSMLDQHGGRIPIYPAEVKGRWRTRREWVHGVLLLVFLALPWITIGGEPAVLFDLDRHRFHFFGLRLWAHDGPLLFPILGLFAIGLALITALFGRAWCGWACPQTVFLDGVIRRIERLTEGSHLQRRQLDAAPWTFGKFARKTAKWSLFVAFAVILTHSLLAYFFGTDRVITMVLSDPRANFGAFLFIFFVTSAVLFDLVWFREQFCLLVCPYGRIQSVLMDKHTVTVHYDVARGEPRKAKGLAVHGACVDCNRCVSACPTGIDIRNGVQLECIACTACIDACDDVMRKTHQPEGLISHRTVSGKPPLWLRSRVLLYVAILVLLGVGLAVSLGDRRDLEVTVLRSLSTPYLELPGADGHAVIVNSYRLHAHNQSQSAIDIGVSVSAAGLTPSLNLPAALLRLEQNQSRMIPFTVEIPKEQLRGKALVPLKFVIQNRDYEVDFVAPGN